MAQEPTVFAVYQGLAICVHLLHFDATNISKF